MANTSIQINQGTNTNVAGDSVGGTLYQTVKIDVGTAGASSPFTGSVTNIGTINVGTVVNNGGSVQVYQGTIQINPTPSTPILTFGTIGTTGGAVYGTLVPAPGVGTSIWVTSYVISEASGAADWLLGFGTATQGSTVIIRSPSSNSFNQGFSQPVNGNITNKDLVFWLSAAGTLYVNITYYVQ